MEQGSQGSQLKHFTYEELSKFDGQQEPQIYISIKNEVFDVSSSDFYKVGASYNVFAGHEASVALAKMKKEPEYLDPSKYDWKTCLDEKEQKILEDWYVKLA